MLDYRLKTFLTLCETLNYRVTAEILNLTQPAITGHIKHLENYYKCKLFNYNGKVLTPTENALLLKKYAISANYQEIRLLDSLQNKESITLSIGATKTIGEFVIAKQVANFLSNKNNNISVVIDNTERNLELLNHSKIDFAIVEGFFNQDYYSRILYKKEPFIGFCSTSHPFANKSVPMSAIFNENIIVREQGSGTRDILEQILIENNYTINSFKKIICINNFGLIKTLTANNCGITFAYEAMGKENPDLSTFTIENLSIEREFNYIYLPETDGHKLIKFFDSFRNID